MEQLSNLEQFPYPFKGDVYRYSNNSTPLEQQNCVEITTKYLQEIQLKRKLLANHPSRCYQSLPHTLVGQWEVLDLVIKNLVTFYPEHFSVEKNGNRWTFYNYLLDEKHCFIFEDESTLPNEPLDFIGRHVQEDLILMMQRDGNIYLDAGQLCFPANWSIAFNLGMNFKQIHMPIPGFQENNLDDKILRFLLQLEAGNPWWRKNWSLMAGHKLDTSLETFDSWGEERKKVAKENVGSFVHLRVEVQKLFWLPRSYGILFSIHTHLLPLSTLVLKKDWLEEFYAILQELPDYIADYKGISSYKEIVLAYLQEQLESR